MKHLKIILILCLSIVASAHIAADELYHRPVNSFSLRAGAEITSAKGGGDYYGNGIGTSAGVVFTHYFYGDFYLEPGAYIFYDTFSQTIFIHPDDQPAQLSQVDGSIRNLGFRLPLNLGYRFPISENLGLKLFTGPQMNFSLMARSHFNKPQGTGNDQLNDTDILGKRGFKRFDLQWNFGVGLDYNRWYVAINAATGLTKVMNRTFEHFRRNYLYVSLGYTF